MTTAERNEAVVFLERVSIGERDRASYYERVYEAYQSIHHHRVVAFERAIVALKAYQCEEPK